MQVPCEAPPWSGQVQLSSQSRGTTSSQLVTTPLAELQSAAVAQARTPRVSHQTLPFTTHSSHVGNLPAPVGSSQAAPVTLRLAAHTHTPQSQKPFPAHSRSLVADTGQGAQVLPVTGVEGGR